MQIEKKLLLVATILLIFIMSGCSSNPSASANSGSEPATSSGPDELDMAIRDASDYLNDNIPEGSMIVILNVQSDSAALSEYIIDELIANAVRDKLLKVVDRQQLDLIRSEQNFQLSGEVDDNLALSIGKIFGAQTIVSGRVRQLDDRFRMTIRALAVQTAQVQGQYNRNIFAGKTITALMRSSSSGVPQISIARTTGSGSSISSVTGGTSDTATRTGPAISAVTVSPNNVSVDKGKTQQFSATITGTNNPDPAVIWIVTNNTSGKTTIGEDGVLTVGDDESITPLIVTATSKTDTSKKGSATVAVPGGIEALNVNSAATWNAAVNRIRDGGDNQTWFISVTGTVAVNPRPYNEYLFGSVTGLIVTIQGGGTLTLSSDGRLLPIGPGQTVIARNVTFRGLSNNSFAVVDIASGGTFRMEAGTAVAGNNGGSGVQVSGGRFTMSGGVISGNSKRNYGGGVYVGGGTFTMGGGTISNNTSNMGNFGGGGGGVCIDGGIFTMSGGTISDNTTDSGGGGVYIRVGSFIMQGGVISGNTNTYSGFGGRGGGVYVSDSFTMSGGEISGNSSNSDGGGVSVNGTFTMRSGAISGNTASKNGGGVYISRGSTINKTGGIIHGSDADQSPGNSALQGNAVYWDNGPHWRNATAGLNVNADGNNFWMND